MDFTTKANVTTTDVETLIDVPTGFMIRIHKVHIANHAAGSIDINLYINDGTTSFYYFKSKALASKDKELIDEAQPFFLRNGDELRFSTDTAGDVSVFVTGTLMPGPFTYVNFI